MAEFPISKGLKKSKEGIELDWTWSFIFAIRDVVLSELEKARIEKVIGSSLEASVEVFVGAHTYERLKDYEDQLRYIFIVSQVRFAQGDEDYTKIVATVKVHQAEGEKCERCWNYSTRVGESARYPTACERCVEALAEIEGGAA